MIKLNQRNDSLKTQCIAWPLREKRFQALAERALLVAFSLDPTDCPSGHAEEKGSKVQVPVPYQAYIFYIYPSIFLQSLRSCTFIRHNPSRTTTISIWPICFRRSSHIICNIYLLALRFWGLANLFKLFITTLPRQTTDSPTRKVETLRWIDTPILDDVI